MVSWKVSWHRLRSMVSSREETMAMEAWKSNNSVCKHTARLIANNECTSQRNKINAKNCSENLPQFAPFWTMWLARVVKNGTWACYGFVSNLCNKNIGASPFQMPMQILFFQMPWQMPQQQVQTPWQQMYQNSYGDTANQKVSMNSNPRHQQMHMSQ